MPFEIVPQPSKSNSGIPIHGSTHGQGGSDPVVLGIAQINGLKEILADIPTNKTVVGEVLSPAPDGNNNVFQTSKPPIVNKEIIMYNGIEMTRAVDYAISSNKITFVFSPEVNSKLTATYTYNTYD